MILPLVLNPDERLKKACQPVLEITADIERLLDNLGETMIAHDGVGLAAPQVGKNLQVAVVEEDEGALIELINPKIVKATGKTIDVEGCLSIPHVYGTVQRAQKIVVHYYDREGDEMELVAYDYLARAIQHEIDHLQGILFTEKMIEQIPEEKLESYMEAKHDD
ncbi:peptide deformylase [Enterococcus asini]|uniref:peptide deformylase n=2 Tax=Enterococcus TaxID=1350 RepID=UPI00289287DB|nr:peptide deformylase [Enterococcus asini]MDT2757542.1 peptide deformylase [Enterococcus asini]